KSGGSTTSVISAYRRWASHLARTFAAERCAISFSYHVDRQIRFALIVLGNQCAAFRRKAIITHHSTIGDNMDAKTYESAGKCPFADGRGAHTNRDWWPNQLDIQVLHHNSNLSDPM